MGTPKTSEIQEKRDGKIPVMEAFYTLQGEGRWAGHPAYFIRLAGCDVGCHWCDVKESWDIQPDQWREIAELARVAKGSGTEIVVITGGEPAMHDLDALTRSLKELGLRTHIETSGAHPVSGEWDWVTLSPKKFKPAMDAWFEAAHELKVVVYNRHDLKWAEELASQCDPSHTRFLLQPEWSRRDRVHEIIEYIKAHPHWSLSLQTHKYVNIP